MFIVIAINCGVLCYRFTMNVIYIFSLMPFIQMHFIQFKSIQINLNLTLSIID